jgi:hypothetical protein
MENFVGSLEDFKFLELEEFNQEFMGLSHWKFADASDADSVEKHHHFNSKPRTIALRGSRRRRWNWV